MESRAVRSGKGNMMPVRILFLLLAISIASSWASPLRAEGPPRPVGYYIDLALLAYPSLASMRQPRGSARRPQGVDRTVERAGS